MALAKIFGTTTEPYKRLPPVAVKVIYLRESNKGHHWEFLDEDAKLKSLHENVQPVICDSHSFMKFVLFESLASQVRVGKSYIIRNYRISKYASPKVMLSKMSTTIYSCAPIDVPPGTGGEKPPLTTIASTLCQRGNTISVTLQFCTRMCYRSKFLDFFFCFIVVGYC